MMTTAKEIAKQVNSLLGKDVVRMASDPYFKVEYFKTGVLPVDVLLGGGIPRGRFTEFYGDFSTLKSYVALKTIAEVQRSGGTCVLIDTEHSFDPEWAESLGVDVGELIVQHPENGEMAVDVTEAFIRAGVDLIVWDSVAATLPKDEQEKRATDAVQPARLAALMSRAMRKLTAANSKTAILCINQTREKVGIVFGSNESVPGGKALPFYASYRIAMRKAGKIQEEIKVHDGEKWTKGKQVTGHRIRATLEKSKLSAPNREVTFIYDLKLAAVDDFMFMAGYGVEYGLVRNEGQSWSIPELTEFKVIRGRENFIQALRESETAANYLRDRLLTFCLGEEELPKTLDEKQSDDSLSSAEDEYIPEAEQVESRTTVRQRKPILK